MGLDLIDLPFANVAKHFEVAAQFIDDALNAGGMLTFLILVAFPAATLILSWAE